MRKAIEVMKDWCCEHIHGGFRWPINGHMTCRGCLRESHLKAVR
jgi:hypothetical protein